MNIRESLEQREKKFLSPYAAFSSDSKGREVPEEECDLRTVYQRDRDRILHSKSFRRLKNKTQVFLIPQGDHYRNRLTHTLEVSQIARTVAKALDLNEDLVEAIALGHDLGHTPFGHAGERALDQIHTGGFAHYLQSVRVVEKLEKNGEGLNLTWEVRDGIMNHRTSGSPSTLEGQIVRLSDKIAYIHHDMDDAIRAGILTEDDIPITLRVLLGFTPKERLDTFITDVINNSMGKDTIRMSEDIEQGMKDLRALMFRNVYENSNAKFEENKAIHLVQELYRYFLRQPERMSDTYKAFLYKGEPLETVVCDYISGMTDQYAVDAYKKIFLPKAWEQVSIEARLRQSESKLFMD